jgi:hypothetical protein
MTRFTLATLAALFVLPVAHAQVSFGLKAGLNVSSFSGSDAPNNTDPRLGFAGGVTADVPLGMSGLAFRPEVLYTMKGVQSANGNTTLAVDYIEVPALLAYEAPVTYSGLRLGAYAGPTLAFKVRESLDGRLGSVNADVFNSTDVGAAFGATAGAGAFSVDARYTLGLTDAADNLSLRNNAFTISGVYRFGRY